MIQLNGSDYNGTGGFVTVDPGTYPVTLKAARMYQNNEFESDTLMTQIGLLWDTGLIGENNDGEEIDVIIFDDWIRFSLNEKANLTKRLFALLGNAFDPNTAKVHIELEDGITSLDELPHWRERKVKVKDLTINGESIFGREALVTVTHNTKGYPKVTNISSPAMAPAGGKLKRKPANAPN